MQVSFREGQVQEGIPYRIYHELHTVLLYEREAKDVLRKGEAFVYSVKL